MLILTRKLNEEIKINSDITFKILSITDNQVKIGIEAPGQYLILRGELYEKVKETTIQASENSKIGSVSFSGLKVNKLKDQE